MQRPVRHEIHPLNPQVRLLQAVAAQIRAGAVVALPTASGYVLACRLDDKAATEKLRRHADSRAPAALLYRDLAQAASYLQIGNDAFRAVRAASDGGKAFVLRSTRRIPRRLAAAAQAATLLHFAGHAATQGLLELLDEPLFIATHRAVAMSLEALPAEWQAALDAGSLPGARAAQVVDLDDLLQARPSLMRWMGAAEPALA